jgi:cell division protein FtsZ
VGRAASQHQQPRSGAPAAQKPAAGEERHQRFGINSLINRMTGHSAAPDAPRPARQQPQVQSSPTQQAAPRAQDEDEQIEIPAFLRRQAN